MALLSSVFTQHTNQGFPTAIQLRGKSPAAESQPSPQFLKDLPVVRQKKVSQTQQGLQQVKRPDPRDTLPTNQT